MIYKYDGKAAKGELAGWRAWRVKITEPGVWMIHCHLLVHMVWGMNTVSYEPLQILVSISRLFDHC